MGKSVFVVDHSAVALGASDNPERVTDASNRRVNG
jgi:hypothetical protein